MDEAEIWATVDPGVRAGLEQDERHVVAAELDGSPPAEAVLYVDHVPEDEAQDSKSLIWVMRCDAGAWSVIGTSALDIEDAWWGYYEGPPGIVVARAETVAGVPHPMLRVELQDYRGSFDPRFDARRFYLLHLVEDDLVLAFSCRTHASFVAGPDRDDVGFNLQTVTYRGGSPARIHVRLTGTSYGRAIRPMAVDYLLGEAGVFEAAGEDLCAF